MPSTVPEQARSEASQFYLQLLFDAKTDFLRSFQGEQESTVIYDPQFGEIRGSLAISQYYDHYRSWLLGENAVVELKREWPLLDSSAAPVQAAEFILHLERQGADIPIPVLVIHQLAEPEKEQGGFVRIYHSHENILGKHCWRKPFLPELDLEITGVAARYMAALREGNLDAILASFDLERAYVAKSSGEKLQGREAFSIFYTEFFDLMDGGAVIHLCSHFTADGGGVAEYYIDRIGKKNCLPQAGALVYRTTAAREQLRAIRLYDDFDPELEICLGK